MSNFKRDRFDLVNVSTERKNVFRLIFVNIHLNRKTVIGFLPLPPKGKDTCR